MQSIEQLHNEFLDNAKKKDLQLFAEKQYVQLLDFQKQLKLLQEENQHLKKLLTENQSLIIEPAYKISNEEAICLQQIEKLKQISDVNDLTLEESKKFSEFVKVLFMIRNKDKSNYHLNEYKTEDLMKLVEEEVKNENK